MLEKLHVGIIPELNSMPIFYSILNNKEQYEDEFTFVIDKVSVLNKMMNRNELDISICSSLNYAFHQDKFDILPNLSVSTIGKVNSIYLFSSCPWKELDKTKIKVTQNSLTAAYLLRYLLRDFTIEYSQEKEINQVATLLTADEAITAFYANKTKYVYDLAELWHKQTNLPFVFALWLVKKTCVESKKKLILKIGNLFLQEKENRKAHYQAIAEQYGKFVFPSNKDCIAYLENFSYDLTESHQEGYLYFQKVLVKQGLLPNEAKLSFLD